MKVRNQVQGNSGELRGKSFCAIAMACLLLVATKYVEAQENIPIGSWRSHLSFNSVKLLASGNNTILAASDNGVVQYDLQDNTFTTYSTLNALSTTGITAIGFDEIRKQILVGYSDGTLDLIGENSVVSFTRLKSPPDVPVSGSINQITISGSLAYISTNYGLVLFDLIRNEVRETWRNLGAAGQLLAIYQSILLDDSIYLATAQGVLKGKLNDNLLDFNQWTRFSSGDFNTSIKLITVFNEKVYVAINTKGVFSFNGGLWTTEVSLPVLTTYAWMQAGTNSLLVSGDQRVITLDETEIFSEITDALIVQPLSVLQINSSYWIADGSSGLISNSTGDWRPYLPNGPASSYTFNTKFSAGEIIATHGGFTSQIQPNRSLKKLSKFSKGSWTTLSTQVDYITDVETGEEKSLYVASYGDGLEKINADGSSQHLFDENSVLANSIALARTINGLWIATYGAAQSLHFLSPDNTLLSFSFPFTASRYPFDLAVDGSENTWMLLAPNGGGGVFIAKKDGTTLRYLTDQPGSGLLPDKEVLSISVDKSDFVWVGTAKGVAYYTFVGEDGIRPIVEGRFLLSEERVTAVAVDEGNRKWMGTERGVWLFSASGEEALYNFTTDNSPLPSNSIRHIEVDPITGEVFFTTSEGLISFRADATEGVSGAEEIKIFPNPIGPDFSGLVGITNLYANAIVKITDVGGKLVNQLQANGGTASWNVTDYTGKRVSTGVYLVIASAQDGSESLAGKIVVID